MPKDFKLCAHLEPQAENHGFGSEESPCPCKTPKYGPCASTLKAQTYSSLNNYLYYLEDSLLKS